MSAVRRHPPRLRRRLLSGLVVILLLSLAGQRSDLLAQSPNTKLTTVLQDLAGAIAQDTGSGISQIAVVRPLVASAMPKSVQDSIQSRRVRLDDASRVQVYVLMTEVTDAAVQQLTAVGAAIEIQDREHRRVQARVPVQRLQAVAMLPVVTFVRLPTYAVRHAGAVQTEGDAILRDDVARSQFGLDGTGVRVGVISDGIKGIFATGCTSCSGASAGPIATGDLPASTGVRSSSGVLTSASGGIAARSFQSNSNLEGTTAACPGFAGAGAEGTALLEIVHDLAPGAALSFANADTSAAFNQAVSFLAQTNDVVVDDLGFFGEASDGTGLISSNTAGQLNNDGNAIRTYVTSVGNEANIHYLGQWADSGVEGASMSGVTTNGHLHQFKATSDANNTVDVLGLGAQPYDLIRLPAGGEVVTFLTWNDPFGGSSNNYDLYLVTEAGAVVAKSTDVQSGLQDPVEAFDYVNTTGATGNFHIVIQNVHGTAQPRQLNLFSFEPECATSGPLLLAAGRHERHNFNTVARSITGQSDAGGSPVSVISVGAICSGSTASVAAFAGSAAPDESCNDRTHATAEYFSTRGPTLDGRMKPDVSAIDGVSITAAGSFELPFFGTSAAAPHVAGTAALLLQAAPCLTSTGAGALSPVAARTRLRSLITSNAVNVSGTAPDNTFGAGLVDGFASVSHTLPSFGGATSLTVGANVPGGASLTAAQLGFSDPNGCALTGLSWSGGCGTSPGAAMTCGPGTSHVAVAASSNGVSFSTPASIAVTVTSFSVAAAPLSATVTAGQSATYSVTVTPQGGTFPSAVTFSCANLPSQTACSFSPASVTPGSGPVQTTLTISTTSRSSALPTVRVSPPGSRLLLPLAILLTGLLAGIVLFAAASRSVRRYTPAVAALVAAAAIGCGGGGATPSTAAPSATVSPASLTFGTQTVQSTSAPQAVTLSNGGPGALSISGIATSADFSQTNTCGGSLAAGTSCTITVAFAPTASGARTGTLTITDNASGGSQTVSLSGTGQAKGTPPGQFSVDVIGTFGTFTSKATVAVNVQ